MDGTEVEIRACRSVGPNTVALVLAAPPGFDARPGQFVQVRATVDGETVTRHFSISSPTVGDAFEVTVGVDPDGTLSPWLAAVAPGETLFVDGPFGRVYYEDETAVVVLAAGPGIGPAVGVAERATMDGGDATVVYRADRPVHEARLAGLAAAGAIVYVASSDEAFRAATAAAVGTGQVFVFGFEPFVETVRDVIADVGGDPAVAKVENFG